MIVVELERFFIIIHILLLDLDIVNHVIVADGLR